MPGSFMALLHGFLNAFSWLLLRTILQVLQLDGVCSIWSDELLHLFGVMFLSGWFRTFFPENLKRFHRCLSCADGTIHFAVFVVPSDNITPDFIINMCIPTRLLFPLLWSYDGRCHPRNGQSSIPLPVLFCRHLYFAPELVLAGICGAIIDAFGFIPNTIQTANSIFGIKLTSIYPGCNILPSGIALLFYPISKSF